MLPEDVKVLVFGENHWIELRILHMLDNLCTSEIDHLPSFNFYFETSSY